MYYESGFLINWLLVTVYRQVITMTLNLSDDVAEQLKSIAELENRSPEDVIRDLLNQYQPIAPTRRRQPRTPNLGAGTIHVRDDFDDPLPDSFWLGEE
jgi:hypothetical protein